MTEIAADRAKRIAYVIQALQLDPTRHSDAIVAARTEALGLQVAAAETASVDIQQNRRLRQQATTALNQIRQGFWKLSNREADAELDRIAAFGFKELDTPVARLRIVARHRQSFHDLADVTKVPSTFVDMLQDVFSLAPRDSADLKESIRLSFRRPLWRRAPRQLVKALKGDLPELYVLEARWFDSLLNQRLSLLMSTRARKDSRLASVTPRTSGDPQPQGNAIPWWLVPLIIVVLNALRAIFQQR